MKTHAYGGKFVRYMNKFISAIICLQIRHSNYGSIMFRARQFHKAKQHFAGCFQQMWTDPLACTELSFSLDELRAQFKGPSPASGLTTRNYHEASKNHKCQRFLA